MQDQFAELDRQWRRHLRGRNVAPKTVTAYTASLGKFAQWARTARPGVDPTALVTGDFEEFFAALFETVTRFGRPTSASTVAMDFRQLRVFFNWVADIEEIDSPMRKVKPPVVPEKAVPVMVDGELRALLDACKGKTFTERRDRTIIRMLFDSGIRRAELAGLMLGDVDLDEQTIKVMGKGRRERIVPYGSHTADELDGYLRARAKHRDARLPNLWLSDPMRRGALGYDGVAQMLERRAAAAGVSGVHAHRFRHTAAHTQLEAGMSEGDAMIIFGWRTRDMVDRYGKSAAAGRAVKAARRISHADRI